MGQKMGGGRFVGEKQFIIFAKLPQIGKKPTSSNPRPPLPQINLCQLGNKTLEIQKIGVDLYTGYLNDLVLYKTLVMPHHLHTLLDFRRLNLYVIQQHNHEILTLFSSQDFSSRNFTFNIVDSLVTVVLKKLTMTVDIQNS